MARKQQVRQAYPTPRRPADLPDAMRDGAMGWTAEARHVQPKRPRHLHPVRLKAFGKKQAQVEIDELVKVWAQAKYRISMAIHYPPPVMLSQVGEGGRSTNPPAVAKPRRE